MYFFLNVVLPIEIDSILISEGEWINSQDEILGPLMGFNKNVDLSFNWTWISPSNFYYQ